MSRNKSVIIEVMGESGYAQAVKPLIDQLGSADDNIQQTAIEALVKIGEPAIESLISIVLVCKHEMLAKQNPNLRVKQEQQRITEPTIQPENAILASRQQLSTVRALEGLGNKQAVEPLISMLKHADSNMRLSAARALAAIKDPRAVEPLIELLEDSEATVRTAAAESLGNLDDKRSVQPLIVALKVALKDEDGSVIRSTVWSLGVLGDEQAVEPLLSALRYDRNDGLVDSTLIAAFVRLGEQSVEPLFRELKSDNSRSWKFAIRILSTNEAVAERLASRIMDEREPGKSEAIEIINRYGSIKTLVALGAQGEQRIIKRFCTSFDRDERIEGVNALSELIRSRRNTKKAIDQLSGMARSDRDEIVRSDAEWELEWLREGGYL